MATTPKSDSATYKQIVLQLNLDAGLSKEEAKKVANTMHKSFRKKGPEAKAKILKKAKDRRSKPAREAALQNRKMDPSKTETTPIIPDKNRVGEAGRTFTNESTPWEGKDTLLKARLSDNTVLNQQATAFDNLKSGQSQSLGNNDFEPRDEHLWKEAHKITADYNSNVYAKEKGAEGKKTLNEVAKDFKKSGNAYVFNDGDAPKLGHINSTTQQKPFEGNKRPKISKIKKAKEGVSNAVDKATSAVDKAPKKVADAWTKGVDKATSTYDKAAQAYADTKTSYLEGKDKITAERKAKKDYAKTREGQRLQNEKNQADINNEYKKNIKNPTKDPKKIERVLKDKQKADAEAKDLRKNTRIRYKGGAYAPQGPNKKGDYLSKYDSNTGPDSIQKTGPMKRAGESVFKKTPEAFTTDQQDKAAGIKKRIESLKATNANSPTTTVTDRAYIFNREHEISTLQSKLDNAVPDDVKLGKDAQEASRKANRTPGVAAQELKNNPEDIIDDVANNLKRNANSAVEKTKAAFSSGTATINDVKLELNKRGIVGMEAIRQANMVLADTKAGKSMSSAINGVLSKAGKVADAAPEFFDGVKSAGNVAGDMAKDAKDSVVEAAKKSKDATVEAAKAAPEVVKESVAKVQNKADDAKGFVKGLQDRVKKVFGGKSEVPDEPVVNTESKSTPKSDSDMPDEKPGLVKRGANKVGRGIKKTAIAPIKAGMKIGGGLGYAYAPGMAAGLMEGVENFYDSADKEQYLLDRASELKDMPGQMWDSGKLAYDDYGAMADQGEYAAMAAKAGSDIAVPAIKGVHNFATKLYDAGNAIGRNMGADWEDYDYDANKMDMGDSENLFSTVAENEANGYEPYHPSLSGVTPAGVENDPYLDNRTKQKELQKSAKQKLANQQQRTLQSGLYGGTDSLQGWADKYDNVDLMATTQSGQPIFGANTDQGASFSNVSPDDTLMDYNRTKEGGEETKNRMAAIKQLAALQEAQYQESVKGTAQEGIPRQQWDRYPMVKRIQAQLEHNKSIQTERAKAVGKGAGNGLDIAKQNWNVASGDANPDAKAQYLGGELMSGNSARMDAAQGDIRRNAANAQRAQGGEELNIPGMIGLPSYGTGMTMRGWAEGMSQADNQSILDGTARWDDKDGNWKLASGKYVAPQQNSIQDHQNFKLAYPSYKRNPANINPDERAFYDAYNANYRNYD